MKNSFTQKDADLVRSLVVEKVEEGMKVVTTDYNTYRAAYDLAERIEAQLLD